MIKHKNEEDIPAYYVYEWYRISDQHVFYVGKGGQKIGLGEFLQLNAILFSSDI